MRSSSWPSGSPFCTKAACWPTAPRSRSRATSRCRTPISGGCMNTSLLELDRVNAYYGDSHILFDVSLHVRQHEVVALLGRNGAGKTTTLRTIMGVLSARRGAIRLAGKPIEHLPPYAIA